MTGVSGQVEDVEAVGLLQRGLDAFEAAGIFQ